MVQGESLSSWHKTSAADLGGAFRAKRVSPVEVLDDVLRQYERVNDSINAIVTPDEAAQDRPRTQARSALLQGNRWGLSTVFRLQSKIICIVAMFAPRGAVRFIRTSFPHPTSCPLHARELPGRSSWGRRTSHRSRCRATRAMYYSGPLAIRGTSS